MQLEQHLNAMMMVYPSIFPTRSYALAGLFLSYGTGYEWGKGVLAYPWPKGKCEDKTRWKEGVRRAKAGVFEVLPPSSSIQRMQDEWAERDAKLEARMKEKFPDYVREPLPEPPPLPEVKVGFEHLICGYSPIFHVPDDVKPDWLAGVREAIELVKNAPDEYVMEMSFGRVDSNREAKEFVLRAEAKLNARFPESD